MLRSSRSACNTKGGNMFCRANPLIVSRRQTEDHQSIIWSRQQQQQPERPAVRNAGERNGAGRAGQRSGGVEVKFCEVLNFEPCPAFHALLHSLHFMMASDLTRAAFVTALRSQDDISSLLLAKRRLQSRVESQEAELEQLRADLKRERFVNSCVDCQWQQYILYSRESAPSSHSVCCNHPPLKPLTGNSPTTLLRQCSIRERLPRSATACSIHFNSKWQVPLPQPLPRPCPQNKCSFYARM